MNPNQQPTSAAIGLVEGMKQKFQLDSIVEKLKESRGHIVDILLYGGLGVVIGFLLKRYSTFVIMAILTCAFIALLHQLNFLAVVFNWNYIQEQFGINPSIIENGNFLAMMWGWIRANMVITISLIVGFLFGLKCADA